jgi:hypothetical protein
MLADKALSPLDAPFQSQNAQLIIFYAQNDLIANVDAQRFAKSSRDNDTPIFVDSS